MKRQRTSGGSVTGGTGDVKPQIFTLDSGLAGDVDDYVTNSTVLPVPRFGTMKTKATVFEILSVDWYIGLGDLGDITATHWGYLNTIPLHADGDTSTEASLVNDLLDPRTFACAVTKNNTSTNGATRLRFPIQIDLTDSNGNGILVATDRLTVTGGSVGGTAAAQYICKVKYRLVNIGISEYVGIVQSQQ